MPEPKVGIRPMLYCEIIRTSMCKTVSEGLEGVPGKICPRIPPIARYPTHRHLPKRRTILTRKLFRKCSSPLLPRVRGLQKKSFCRVPSPQTELRATRCCGIVLRFVGEKRSWKRSPKRQGPCWLVRPIHHRRARLPLGCSVSPALSRMSPAALDRNAVQDGRQDSPPARVTIAAHLASFLCVSSTVPLSVPRYRDGYHVHAF